ncbi:MAG: hypothetical protein Q9M13_08165 [Mariprofundales bacterium]|nr:hypothetical protein [Mariprofundales bacterium]
MKIIQRNPVQSRGVGAGKRAAPSQKGAFKSVMDEKSAISDQELADSGVSSADSRETTHRQSGQHKDRNSVDVMLMLVRQGIDVLDDGLLQIEREGLLANRTALVDKMGSVRQQLQQMRKTHGANELLDESETILNVETERLRQLA